MKLKTISLITLGLVVLAVLLSIFDRPRAAPAGEDTLVGRPLVDVESLREVAALEVTGSEDEPVRIERRDDHWLVVSEDGIPADFDRVRRTITPFVEGRIERFVTARPERKESLDLERVRLVLEGEDGDTLLNLEIGRSASRGGVYVQPADSDRAYVFDANLAPPTSASSWIDHTPFEFAAEEVRRITVDFGGVSEEDATLTFERPEEGGEWTVSGGADEAEVNVTELNALLGDLAGLRMTDRVPRSDPEAIEAESFAKTFRIETFEGAEVVIRVGRRPEGVPEAEWASPSEDDPPPDLTDAADEEEEETPAGTPFFFAEIENEASPWAGVADGFAFEISSWNFEQLPTEAADLVNIPEAAAEEEVNAAPEDEEPAAEAEEEG